MADRDDVIRRVQALWAQADHPNTSPAEREVFVDKARELMAKYTIDEMVLNEAKSGNQREDVVLMDIRISKDGEAEWIADQAILLAHFIGTHNRCRQVIQRKSASVDVESGAPIAGGTFLTVCGFRSDCEMARDLYKSLATDMILAVALEPTSHMNKRDKDTYAANFCDGYAMRIDERLGSINRRVHEIADEGGSMALVLRSRESEVKDFFDEMFPNLKTQKMAAVRRDDNARARGSAAADKAELGQTKLGHEKKAVGQG